MKLLYRLFFFLVPGILFLLKPFSGKLRHFLEGRKFGVSKLRKFRDSQPGSLAWFHVASLGEYEQARPIIASLKGKRPDLGVLVSFFSPSGYDHVSKKPQPHVDFISYIPLDRKRWAEEFVGIVQPELAFFVKYDLWFHHIQALKKRDVPTFLVAASLREDQSFFGVLGSFFRRNLFAMDWIFTQNQKSIELLKRIGYTRSSLAGDTRFDRVAATASAPKELPAVKTWIGDLPTVVVGSAWDEDMELLIPLINSRPEYRWIIAPHDLSPEPMDRWSERIELPTARFSNWNAGETNSVLFIDNIGMLSSLYQFAKIAYVGGAFGKGLHNILEPLGFGCPVIFGEVRKASKFPEAEQSQQEGCGFSVSDEGELFATFEKLEKEDFYDKSVKSAQNWVSSNLGAADRITAKVTQLTSQS
ncbi:3-deoxy-D-manno-octulosonic acid transferase [Algoriphagus sp. H41]|uniref:3-deoxy-D-manno-octulosonic acid transferase n=1 Tax=Algoriphagus oliviformis TaxID=2811231 RepID=A0ABS3C223_9BACT|nr:glycosyltransferase N-terminal domain-containing protein [Algoriphagus oliviformis]MBN7810220.1 3-deoxy-D-manno-octulosonic acid transferase [Algoriphagus oliviformis]